MAWRVLQRRGMGTDARALALLAVVSCLFTAILEAAWIWVYQGFEPSGTLANNFSLELGLSPAWEILALGLLITIAAAVRRGERRAAAA